MCFESSKALKVCVSVGRFSPLKSSSSFQVESGVPEDVLCQQRFVLAVDPLCLFTNTQKKRGKKVEIAFVMCGQFNFFVCVCAHTFYQQK